MSGSYGGTASFGLWQADGTFADRDGSNGLTFANGSFSGTGAIGGGSKVAGAAGHTDTRLSSGASWDQYLTPVINNFTSPIAMLTPGSGGQGGGGGNPQTEYTSLGGVGGTGLHGQGGNGGNGSFTVGTTASTGTSGTNATGFGGGGGGGGMAGATGAAVCTAGAGGDGAPGVVIIYY
jgi:hypothetical protein